MNQTNQTNQTNETNQSPHHYRIGDELYRLEAASYRQHRWLGEGPFKGIDLSQGITVAEMSALIQRQGPEILGIVLIPVGQSREDKAKAGLAAARALGERIDCLLTPEEVRPIAEDFFVTDGYQNLTFFVDFRAAAARTQAAPISNGATPVSAFSPEATLPSATTSLMTPDRETAKAISGGSSSGN